MTTIILNILYWFLLILALSSIPFSLPGPLMIVGINLIYQLLDKAPGIDWRLVIILLVIAGVSELIEYLITAFSSKKSGASQRAVFGSIAGSIAGAIIGTGIFPLIGSLVGALIGSFLGGFITEYMKHQDSQKAYKVGIGAFTGVAGGKLTKLTLAIVMLVIIGFNMA